MLCSICILANGKCTAFAVFQIDCCSCRSTKHLVFSHSFLLSFSSFSFWVTFATIFISIGWIAWDMDIRVLPNLMFSTCFTLPRICRSLQESLSFMNERKKKTKPIEFSNYPKAAPINDITSRCLHKYLLTLTQFYETQMSTDHHCKRSTLMNQPVKCMCVFEFCQFEIG